MNNHIEIERSKTFDLPEGVFRATLRAVVPQIKHTHRGAVDYKRFLFEVDVPSLSKTHLPMAGCNFPVSGKRHSEIRCFLENWLGRGFFDQTPCDTFDLDSLIGRECELTLKHHQNPNYDKPLVLVHHIQPAQPPKEKAPENTGTSFVD